MLKRGAPFVGSLLWKVVGTVKNIKNIYGGKTIPKIILCRGIQGSGKTTWAEQWVLEDPEHRVRFNNDDIRNMSGKYWVPSREGLIKDLKGLFLWEAMSYGFDIVIDNMNLNPKELEYYNRVLDDWNNPKGIVPAVVRPKYDLEFKDFLYLFKTV